MNLIKHYLELMGNQGQAINLVNSPRLMDIPVDSVAVDTAAWNDDNIW